MGRPCRAHTSDLRIYIEAVGLATFPDGSLICGPLEQHGASPRSTALNPAILLEITSDSSEEYDTGDKVDFYRSISSLREYIIVSHRERRVTVHTRDADGSWSSHLAVTAGRARVPSLDLELDVDQIYRASAIS